MYTKSYIILCINIKLYINLCNNNFIKQKNKKNKKLNVKV